MPAAETFDAAISGIVDSDMTGAAYQTGKNPALQFVGDVMGGYSTPWECYSWLYFGGGLEQASDLYNSFGMQLIGWNVYGHESLASKKPLDGIEDWRAGSSSLLQTGIFAELGVSPVVMDFTEVFAVPRPHQRLLWPMNCRSYDIIGLTVPRPPCPRAPNSALPTRTCVAPIAIAISKSPLIPIDSFSTPASRPNTARCAK